MVTFAFFIQLFHANSIANNLQLAQIFGVWFHLGIVWVPPRKSLISHAPSNGRKSHCCYIDPFAFIYVYYPSLATHHPLFLHELRTYCYYTVPPPYSHSSVPLTFRSSYYISPHFFPFATRYSQDVFSQVDSIRADLWKTRLKTFGLNNFSNHLKWRQIIFKKIQMT